MRSEWEFGAGRTECLPSEEKGISHRCWGLLYCSVSEAFSISFGRGVEGWTEKGLGGQMPGGGRRRLKTWEGIFQQMYGKCYLYYTKQFIWKKNYIEPKFATLFIICSQRCYALQRYEHLNGHTKILSSILLGACNNCLNLFPTGCWPLTGHQITKSCLIGFLFPAKRDLLCWEHLWCKAIAFNRWGRRKKTLNMQLWLANKLCPCPALCLLLPWDNHTFVPKATASMLLKICLRHEDWTCVGQKS